MIDSFIRDRLPPPEAQPEFLFTLPELHYPERLNAAVELIDRQDPDALAVLNDAGAWTYGEMKDLSDRIARLLVEQEGLVPGNRVFLRGPNNAMLFAVLARRAQGRRRGRHDHADAPPRRDRDHPRARPDLATPSSTPASAPISTRRAASARSSPMTATTASPASTRSRRASPRSTPAATTSPSIAFTSGTTGKPKGCVHYHRDILAPADAFARHVLKPGAGDRWACSAPIAFTFGLGMLLIFPWRFGGTAVTIETPGPGPLLDAIARHKVTNLATAPTAYKAMIPMLAEHDIASLRTCVSAGEHLPAATWHAWREATGIAIVDGIGATEMMHIFISAAGDDIRPGATGKAVPGYVATVLDEDDRPMASGTGRLAVKGPTGCRYFDDERQADYVDRRLERHRRHLSRGRGRLFLVRRPLRRHDHLLGLQYRRARGGECAPTPTRRCRNAR